MAVDMAQIRQPFTVEKSSYASYWNINGGYSDSGNSTFQVTWFIWSTSDACTVWVWMAGNWLRNNVWPSGSSAKASVRMGPDHVGSVCCAVTSAQHKPNEQWTCGNQKEGPVSQIGILGYGSFFLGYWDITSFKLGYWDIRSQIWDIGILLWCPFLVCNTSEPYKI